MSDRQDATEFTKAINDELLTLLPFEDRQEAQSGEIEVDPEIAPLDTLLGLLDDFDLWFNIVEP